MVPPTDPDRIADALLSDDPETRARHESWATFGTYSLPSKLRAHAYTCAIITVWVLAAVRFGRPVLQASFGVAPLSAHASTTLVLASGLQFLTMGAVGLGFVSLLRRRTPREDHDVERLLALEETATVVGLGTGGLGVVTGLVTLGLLAVPDALPAAWRAQLSTPVGIPIGYDVVVWWAAALAVACGVASVMLSDGEWTRSDAEL